ncbi:hypothetical protein CERSUDRAFT_109041 [Gelatoporia subvermispora B]|uniref:G domain-containing protein n=1 Tax=Ceriporiopsis subvermispora (strain B) TaxID=914234 RepID=M2P9M1_CERS8|nr:hypothetical protein CERSUDRAFT_109041 [Gelatoporia subvermispora B]
MADSEVIVAVMGATGSGKTTFINLVSGANFATNDGLRSCTAEVQTSKSFALLGRQVTLIDTPGFDDTTRSDTDILKVIADYLCNAYQNQKKLSGIIYMHRISDSRMGGTSKRNFTMFRKLCGDDTLKNVLIVTNMWGEVSAEVGSAREKELATDDILFKPVLEKGARMLRHDNTLASAHRILSCLVNNRPEVLQIQDEVVNKHKDIQQTAAAAELARELEEQKRKQQEEVDRVRREHEAAVAAQQEATRRALEQERARIAAEEARARAEYERMRREQEEARIRTEQQAREMQRRLEEEARIAREREEQTRLLHEEQQRQAVQQAAERERLRIELEAAQRRHRRHRGGGDCVVQ